MKLGENGATFLSLPPNLQTDESYALSAAVDKQMKKLLLISNMLQVWTDLDSVDPRFYGIIAACIKAPYYDSALDDNTKLAIIKGTLNVYRLAGTRAAVTQLISDLFGKGIFEAWYEYGGAPYHFRITTDVDLSPNALLKCTEILKKVKRARSVLDSVSKAQTMPGHTYSTACLTEGDITIMKEMMNK